jgi:hypothetical protein
MFKSFKSLRVALIGVIFLITGCATTNTSTAPEPFSGAVNITNDTGYDIYYLYISHESTDSWEDDLLGSDVLYDGESFKVNLGEQSSSIFDVTADDSYGDTYTIFGVDMTSGSLTITADD